jgi:hypothetical protein
MLIKITCNNCGDVAVFDKDYMTSKRKRCFDCYICRNNNKEYNEIKNFFKKNNNNVYDNFNLNECFGRHKGFTFENITEEEFEKMKEVQNEKR